MDTLSLSPLPSEFSKNAKGYQRIRNEGFVDESVVLALLAKDTFERVYPKPEEMVLSSSPDDFAGWALPVESPFRRMVEVEAAAENRPMPDGEIRHAAAPMLPGKLESSEPGISEPHRGNHRWWLFGVSGAMCCAIFAMMLLSLAQRAIIAGTIADYTPVIPNFTQDEIIVEEPEVGPALVDVTVGQ